jgi:hypothetical protein
MKSEKSSADSLRTAPRAAMINPLLKKHYSGQVFTARLRILIGFGLETPERRPYVRPTRMGICFGGKPGGGNVARSGNIRYLCPELWRSIPLWRVKVAFKTDYGSFDTVAEAVGNGRADIGISKLSQT